MYTCSTAILNSIWIIKVHTLTYEHSVNIQFIFLIQLYHKIRENNQKSRDFTTFLMREVLGVNDGVLQAVNLAKIFVHDMGIGHCNLNTGVA